MKTSFFELVNDKFFSPFTSINKQLNYDLLCLINSKMNNEMKQFPRDEVLSWLIDYVENCPISIIDDETGKNDSTDIKIVASNKLRYFLSCGWLVDENDSKTLKTTYQMDSNAIIILNAMEEIVKNDTRPVEYTGYVYNIYSSLKNFHASHSTDIVEQMYKNTKDLMDRLRGLNVSIKKYLRNLISNDTLSPREILEQFLIEYQDKVVLKTFDNLRIKDNPSKYKNSIINDIKGLLEEPNFSKMVEEYINKKKNGEKNEENQKEAEAFFSESLEYVLEQFKYIEDNLESLNRRNTKYATTAKSRIAFLLNEEVDIEGKIIDLLKNIAKTDDYIDEDTPFSIFDLGKLDENSLYTPRTNRKKVNVQIETVHEPVDEIELQKARERLLNETKFNSSSVDKFIRRQLGERKSITASQMKIDGIEDVIMVFLAGLYSQNKMVSYTITYNSKTFNWQDKMITDYIVERKK